jgi:hypothetical protein
MPEIKLIQVSLVRIDGQTQYRDLVDQNTVKEYADRMRDDVEFPPVRCTFDGQHYWLWDGFHRYFATQAAEFRDIRVEFTHGTQEDAQDFALGANGKHGLPRNNATKRKQVEAALSMERHAHKSDREIARLCDVSAPFVAAVRSPQAKEKQAANRQAFAAKQVTSDSTSNPSGTASACVIGLHPDIDPIPRLTEDYGPDADELKAMELAEQADRDTMYKMLESDDALATAVKEIERLNFLNAQMKIRIDSLMNERNACITQIKRLEHQIVMKSGKGS